MELCTSSNYQHMIELSAFTYCSYLFYNVEWSFFSHIVCIFFIIKNKALHFLGLLGSLSRIVWFFFPISHLGWEVFHQTSRVRFPLTYLISLWFSSPISHQDWEVFHQIYLRSFGFLPQYLIGLGGFFINRSRIFLIVFTGLGA